MQKELFIASSPHETKVAVLENDSLVEVYYERDTQTGLVGGIYKGRVSRVLPGMQSAFVDIGLERDAFLYVSDFYEDAEEYDRIVADAEARVTRLAESRLVATPEAAPAAPMAEAAPQAAEPSVSVEPSEESPQGPAIPSPPSLSETAPPSPAPNVPSTPKPGRGQTGYHRQEQRGRHRRWRGRGRYGEHRGSPRPESHHWPSTPPQGESRSFEILPGESLAKYSHAAPAAPMGETLNPAPTEIAPPSETPSSIPVPPAEALPEVRAEPRHPADAGPAAPPVEEVYARESSAGVSPPSETAPPSPPAAESVLPASAAAPASEIPSEHKPLWQRLVSSVFGEGSERGPAASAEGVRHEESEPKAVPVTPVAESTGEPELPAQQAAGERPAVPEPRETGATDPAGAGPPSEDGQAAGADREATLSEPSGRPRFALRRGRRGRRGRGPRQNGGGFRPEPSRSANNQPVQISELLKEGQEIIVQIAKEPLGRKGARITSHVALPGRYLVYMPTVDHIGVSRKITSEEERLRLRNLLLENKGSLTGGFIVRTAGAGKSDEEIKSDIRFLSSLWSDIRAEAEQAKAPALLHRDLDLVQRLLRDLLSPEFKTIWVDSESEYERVVEFVNRCQPSLVGHVKLFTRETPIFEEFGIQAEVEKALKPKVWLKSGGYIVINQTEALVAIDVNTGKYVGKTSRLEDTIVKTNVDAVAEIVRQIRLRDLGGIVVVDFIDMDERRNRNKVVQALEEALRSDRAPTKMIAFHDFGLVAITRKRVKQSLERTLCEPCNYCEGAGWVKSPTTVCYEILAEVRKMKSQLEGDVVTLRVHPEVAKVLKSRDGALLSELEALAHKNFIVKGDSAMHQERFEIY
jgi:ribonuclease G